MKPRSREINVFSMSALDLFASALGAFILIAVVMMPFFPNTGDSPERIADMRAELEGARADLDDTREALEKALAELAEAKDNQLPNLDLVIAVDVTGSMRDLLDGLRAEIAGIVNVLNEMSPELGVGIVWFGDREWDQPIGAFSLVNVTSSTANRRRLLDFVQTLRPQIGLGSGDNDDNPEALLAGLRAAVDQPWRAASEQKVIVVITDNPAYPEEQEAAVGLAAQFAARGGTRVSSVYRLTGSESTATRAFLQRLSDAGNGQLTVSGASPLADLLLSLL